MEIKVCSKEQIYFPDARLGSIPQRSSFTLSLFTTRLSFRSTSLRRHVSKPGSLLCSQLEGRLLMSVSQRRGRRLGPAPRFWCSSLEMPKNTHFSPASRGCRPAGLQTTLSSTRREHFEIHLPQPFQKVQELISYAVPSSAQALLLRSLGIALEAQTRVEQRNVSFPRQT